jgi:hypothetical protein
LKLLGRGKRRNTRTCLASRGGAGLGDVHGRTRHTREWSDDFSLRPWPILASNYSRITLAATCVYILGRDVVLSTENSSPPFTTMLHRLRLYVSLHGEGGALGFWEAPLRLLAERLLPSTPVIVDLHRRYASSSFALLLAPITLL